MFFHKVHSPKGFIPISPKGSVFKESLTVQYMKRDALRFQPQLKVQYQEAIEAPKLWVREVPVNVLMGRWVPYHKDKVDTLPASSTYYVECNKQGTIDWKTTNVYTPTQLIRRNNVIVVELQN